MTPSQEAQITPSLHLGKVRLCGNLSYGYPRVVVVVFTYSPVHVSVVAL